MIHLVNELNKLTDSQVEDAEQDTLNKIINKFRPIYMESCKDAPFLLDERHVITIANVIKRDDELGGELDFSTLPQEVQNLMQWKQVHSAYSKYREIDDVKVDDDSIGSILSRIIRNPMERAADRLKAIQLYKDLFADGSVDGITFVDDLGDLDDNLDDNNLDDLTK